MERSKENFPYNVKEYYETIKLKEGIDLAATIYLPIIKDKRQPQIFRTILEFLPYRKNDGTIIRDSKQLPYFAGYAIASIRVDMRGSGDSDGLLIDEYLESEQNDCIEIIEWIINQQWSSGDVIMWGISWGGFNSLQVAFHKPKALKAIICLAFTDDRYATDVHYIGGLVHGVEMPSWSSYMLGAAALPPDPRIRSNWRELWHNRMNANHPWVDTWVSHQRRDEYWKHASVCENFENLVDIPILSVSGLHDGYICSVFRLLEGLSNTKNKINNNDKNKHFGLCGPWVHLYPEFAVPGPNIGFLQEVIQWINHHVPPPQSEINIYDFINENNSNLFPNFRGFIEDPSPLQLQHQTRSGNWISYNNWPPLEDEPFAIRKFSLIKNKQLNDNQHHILKQFNDGDNNNNESNEAIIINTKLSVGHNLANWCTYGSDANDFHADPTEDDRDSVLFESDLLSEDISMIGIPELKIKFSSNKKIASIGARLTDCKADGTFAVISFGVLNLSHCLSHEFPIELEDGNEYEGVVKLMGLGYRIPAGHRLRLALSSSLWRISYPTPEIAEISLHSAELHLPTYTSKLVTCSIATPKFPPEISTPIEIITHTNESRKFERCYDENLDMYFFVDDADDGIYEFPSKGVIQTHRSVHISKIKSNDPLSASTEIKHSHYHQFKCDEGEDIKIRIETNTQLSVDYSSFHSINSFIAYENDKLVFQKEWKKEIARQFA